MTQPARGMVRAAILLLSMAWTLASAPAAATAQIPDVIVLDGVRLPLNSNPLDAFYEQNPDKWVYPGPTSTANWRGYVAEWRIDARGALWLTAILRGSAQDGASRNTLGDLFPGRQEVAADWYSGMLVIPRGEMVQYVHMGYGSTWEAYTLLEVVRGQVIDRREITGEEWDAYRTAELAKRRAAAHEEERRVAEVLAGLPPEESWLSPREAIFGAAAEPRTGLSGTFVMTVGAVGRGGAVYLNSEADYRDQRNLTVRLEPSAAAELEARLGTTLEDALRGRQIVVVDAIARRTRIDFLIDGQPSGKYYYQTHVRVPDASQLHVLGRR